MDQYGYLDLDDVTLLLPFSVRTLRKFIKEGNLPARKIRGKWLLRVEDVQSFINKLTSNSDSQNAA